MTTMKLEESKHEAGISNQSAHLPTAESIRRSRFSRRPLSNESISRPTTSPFVIREPLRRERIEYFGDT